MRSRPGSVWTNQRRPFPGAYSVQPIRAQLVNVNRDSDSVVSSVSKNPQEAQQTVLVVKLIIDVNLYRLRMLRSINKDSVIIR